jgi:hypothetical protein
MRAFRLLEAPLQALTLLLAAAGRPFQPGHLLQFCCWLAALWELFAVAALPLWIFHAVPLSL